MGDDYGSWRKAARYEQRLLSVRPASPHVIANIYFSNAQGGLTLSGCPFFHLDFTLAILSISE
jgi:hypothetical protein